MSKDPQASHPEHAVRLSMLDTLLAVKREGARIVDAWWDNVPLPFCEQYLEIYLAASRYEFLISKPEADVKAFGFSAELSQ